MEDKKFVSCADLAYEDVILTEEEAAELKRILDNGLCRPTFDLNVEEIIIKED